MEELIGNTSANSVYKNVNQDHFPLYLVQQLASSDSNKIPLQKLLNSISNTFSSNLATKTKIFTSQEIHIYYPSIHQDNRPASITTYAMITKELTEPRQAAHEPSTIEEESTAIHLVTKKKYKPITLKVKPVIGELPDKFRIVRSIIGDPLTNLPTLNPTPPPYVPISRYTQEHKDLFDKKNTGFLLPMERDLLHHFMMLHQDAFTWNDTERGHFREDFFPPVDIPVIPHTPWVIRNIPIPLGIYDDVCNLNKKKLDVGVF